MDADTKMTDDEAFDLLDGAAYRLVRGYASRERIAYVVMECGDGEVRLIGPSLPSKAVRTILLSAASGYEEQQDNGTLN